MALTRRGSDEKLFPARRESRLDPTTSFRE
jgi:hypothetical protein